MMKTVPENSKSRQEKQRDFCTRTQKLKILMKIRFYWEWWDFVARYSYGVIRQVFSDTFRIKQKNGKIMVFFSSIIRAPNGFTLQKISQNLLQNSKIQFFVVTIGMFWTL